VLGFARRPPLFWLVLMALLSAYLGLVELVTRRFERRASAAAS